MILRNDQQSQSKGNNAMTSCRRAPTVVQPSGVSSAVSTASPPCQSLCANAAVNPAHEYDLEDALIARALADAWDRNLGSTAQGLSARYSGASGACLPAGWVMAGPALRSPSRLD